MVKENLQIPNWCLYCQEHNILILPIIFVASVTEDASLEAPWALFSIPKVTIELKATDLTDQKSKLLRHGNFLNSMCIFSE